MFVSAIKCTIRRRRIDAANVSIPENEFTNDETTFLFWWKFVVTARASTRNAKNYAMHVFNRNKNNYIFVVSTMIRCVSTEHAICCSIRVSIDAFRFLILNCEHRTFWHRSAFTPPNPKSKRFFLFSSPFLVFVLLLLLLLLRLHPSAISPNVSLASSHHCINIAVEGLGRFSKMCLCAASQITTFASNGINGCWQRRRQRWRWQPPSEKGKNHKIFSTFIYFYYSSVANAQMETRKTTAGKSQQENGRRIVRAVRAVRAVYRPAKR